MLEEVVREMHPLMVEGARAAAIPYWFDAELFRAVRRRDDGRDQGIIDRLAVYSFMSPMAPEAPEAADGAPHAWAMRQEERLLLQQGWLAEAPGAFRAAHQAALEHWRAHPDPNPFAQAQNLLYHHFFVDTEAAAAELVGLFRRAIDQRHLPAADRLVAAAQEARDLLAGAHAAELAELDWLLAFLRLRLRQLRGDEDGMLEALRALRSDRSLSARLRPYVMRAYGHSLAEAGLFVEAIQQYEEALKAFPKATWGALGPDNDARERATTLIALGDVYDRMGVAARGAVDYRPAGGALAGWVARLGRVLLALPLVLYIVLSLGPQALTAGLADSLRRLDWLVVRIFASAAARYRQAEQLLRNVADPAARLALEERQATLALHLGDPERAAALYRRLLYESPAPLGDYATAKAQAGLGEALLQIGDSAQARIHLELAAPVLAELEDQVGAWQARRLLGEALARSGEMGEGLNLLGQVARFHAGRAEWSEATDAVESAEALAAAPGAPAEAAAQAAAIGADVPLRRYEAGFYHPALRAFRIVSVALLALVLFLAPLITITLDTSVALSPSIHFFARPPLALDQGSAPPAVELELTQGVTSVQLRVEPDRDALLWAALLLIGGYLLLSTLVGVGVIAATSLRSVQEQLRRAAVETDEVGVTAGGGERAAWQEITHWVEADVTLGREPQPDVSAFGMVTPKQVVAVEGSIAHYGGLQARLRRRLAGQPRRVDLSLNVQRSPWAIAYIANLAVFALYALAIRFTPDLLSLYIPLTGYRLVDLYPYLFALPALVPLWWGVVRPLQVNHWLRPRSRLPWLVLAAGVLLMALQVATRFRPLLTAVNLYPPLAAAIMAAAAAIAIWRAREGGKRVAPLWLRLPATALGLTLAVLLAAVLVREVRAYHALVVGNSLRDRVYSSVPPPPNRTELLEAAIDAYTRAYEIGSAPLWRIALPLGPEGAERVLYPGFATRRGATLSIGWPAPSGIPWVLALKNRSALNAELGRYREAVGDYTVLLAYTDSRDKVFAWRGLALQRLGTAEPELMQVAVDEGRYSGAIDDFNRAIALAPHVARYYLWRGAAYHASNELEQAYADYQQALDITGREALRPEERERAYTGQGWIHYQQGDFAASLERFTAATEANPNSSEAWLGRAYAEYALGKLPEAVESARRAHELDPGNPSALILLATIFWRAAGQQDGIEAKCSLYEQAEEQLGAALEQDPLRPQRPEDLAFTHRTRAQIRFLMQSRCATGEERERLLEQAIEDYEAAIELDAEQPVYRQMRARLRIALAGVLDDGARQDELLYRALAELGDLARAGVSDSETLTWLARAQALAGPRLTALGDELFRSGQYDDALAVYTFLAGYVPGGTQRLLAQAYELLLAEGPDEAAAWYAAGIEAAQGTENGRTLLRDARAQFDAYVAGYGDDDGDDDDDDADYDDDGDDDVEDVAAIRDRLEEAIAGE